ncbi:hypothetical protein BYT27DRAFT_7237737 [Phlegmacium glaucopus]|nr:hypothetical protein BYT27DRAFT_7237737 [Phlegmacium glaucopus]
MSDHPHDEADAHFNELVSSIHTERLCAAASRLKADVECRLGGTIVGGFNVLFEIVFADGITWLARCPLTYNCSSEDASDILMQSYAATLKYIKLHTSIPVPEVFACCRKSDKGNDVRSSYILMECLPGRALDLQDTEEDDEQYVQTSVAAEMVFQQLAAFIMQLASLQFDKIGTLQEQPVGSGTFSIAEYFDSGIVYPEERGKIYEASSIKGPFSTVSEYHSALLSLNHNFALADPEDEDGDYLRSVQQCRLLQPKLSLPQYENGPFVVNHDDLSSSNILVDDDYNITGVLDFPGTIVPLPSLCVYPIIFTENHVTPFTDRTLWLQSILDAQPVLGSALNDLEVRKLLMESATSRCCLDHALHHSYAYVAISSLAKKFSIGEGNADGPPQHRKDISPLC